jgi:hypothetical protein
MGRSLRGIRGDGSGGLGQADQLGAHLPEPCRVGLVVATRGGTPELAVGEVAARQPRELGGGSQVA